MPPLSRKPTVFAVEIKLGNPFASPDRPFAAPAPPPAPPAKGRRPAATLSPQTPGISQANLDVGALERAGHPIPGGGVFLGGTLSPIEAKEIAR